MKEFYAIREAVRNAAKEGWAPQDVIALLIKICVEISQTTNALDKKDLAEFVNILWDLNRSESFAKVTTPIDE